MTLCPQLALHRTTYLWMPWPLHAMSSLPGSAPLSSDVFSGVFGTSAMTNIMAATELARQEKVVETGAGCKVKRVFAKNKRGVRGATAVVRSFTKGRRVNWHGCRSSWR